MVKRALNIIILGPQGSGKGTQANLLAKRFKLYHVETGKIFRKLSKQKSTLGRKINYTLNVKGQLLPSSFVIKVLKKELGKVSLKRGLIFDGYPRNIVQAKALDKLLVNLKRELTHIIYMPISREVTMKRLVLRRTCKKCNTIFILGKNIKKAVKKCPRCRGEIYQRDDDKLKAIARRLQEYHKKTEPVVRYYKKKGLLIAVNGKPPIPVVYKSILKYLE